MQINKTKLALSCKEMELVCGTDWILTKQAIIQKVYHLFGVVCNEMQQFTVQQQEQLPAEIFNNSPKISKGENYKGLPYVMLDYPRFFVEKDTMAIRTMFWWGNFFSISIQLSGKYQRMLKPSIIRSFHYFQQHDYWLCINTTPWEHHFENDNYRPVKELSDKEFMGILDEQAFIKIAKKIPLQQWESVPDFINKTFQDMINLLDFLSSKPV
jgi:hypothetical protein